MAEGRLGISARLVRSVFFGPISLDELNDFRKVGADCAGEPGGNGCY